MSNFILDLEKIRQQARRSIDEGALTEANHADRQTVLQMLDAALATEWLCVLRYSQHAVTARGMQAEPVVEEFKEHASQELEHAQWIAERIDQLGGTPHLDPLHLAQRSHSPYVECNSLVDMIRENLVAERIAIISYTEMIRHIGDDDPTTRRLLEKILRVEEEHADDLSSFLDTIDPRQTFSSNLEKEKSTERTLLQ